MNAISKTVAMTLLVALSCSALHADANWPEFRGPRRDGTYASDDLPLRWSESENVVWKTPVHGRAWSTPVVLGDQVWVTTATPDGRELSVLCLDRSSGQVLLDRVLFEVEEPRALGNTVNTYGSPSPAIEPGRVYVSFGSYGTACLDTESFEKLWERRDLECDHFRGPASSLVLFEDLVIFHMDGADHQYIVALDEKSGETRWRTPRSTDYGDLGPDGKPARDGDFRKAYNTPIIVRGPKGRLQLVSPSAKAAYGYDPRTGEEYWQARYSNHSTASRPLYHDGLAFVNTGYPKAELWAVRIDGEGDVTASHVKWKHTRTVPNRSSPVLHDGLLFMVNDKGIASCLEAATGEEVWRERIGGNYSASPLLAPGRIYFFSEEGKATVIAPSRQFEILAENELDGGFMASPAAADGALYLRTQTHVYRIEDVKSRR